MRKDASPSPPAEDLIWLCRRLASALQAGASIAPAVEQASTDAPEGPAALLGRVRHEIAIGRHAAHALEQVGAPAYVSRSVRMGEARADLGRALALIADRLELERAIAPPSNQVLYALSLAIGRLGLMVELGISVSDALESAADSLPSAEAARDLLAVFRDVRAGADLSDALQRRCPALPELTIDMIRDAEDEGRLPEALPVIADYLVDAAGEAKPRRKKQEVRDGS